MARSDVHTAFGGMQLGMSLPLVALGAALATIGSVGLGIGENPVDSPLAVLALMSALLLSMSGALLLWSEELREPGPRPAVRRPARAVAAPRRDPKLWAHPRRVEPVRPHPVVLPQVAPRRPQRYLA
jgi:hypothetical protein